MLCNLADFNIEFNNHCKELSRLCENYITNGEPDYTVTITNTAVEYEAAVADAKYPRHYLEITAAYRALAEWLPLKNAFVFHSAVFDVDGVGVAFAAHSGTGKTTHMLLWQKLLGERLTIVNGDKPIVRFLGDEPYAYGTPWCGKENLGCNMSTPLRHICFIERGEKNSVQAIDKSCAVDLLFNQVYMPKAPQAILATMQLINKLLSSCKLWKISCNMEADAAEKTYKGIFGMGE